MAEDTIIILTEDNFDETVKNSDKPVLVDFWAAWCGPCRAVAPIMEELSAKYGDRVIFGKVDIDNESKLASDFRIMSIPTILLFKEGKVADKIIGTRPKSDFEKLLDKNI